MAAQPSITHDFESLPSDELRDLRDQYRQEAEFTHTTSRKRPTGSDAERLAALQRIDLILLSRDEQHRT